MIIFSGIKIDFVFIGFRIKTEDKRTVFKEKIDFPLDLPIIAHLYNVHNIIFFLKYLSSSVLLLPCMSENALLFPIYTTLYISPFSKNISLPASSCFLIVQACCFFPPLSSQITPCLMRCYPTVSDSYLLSLSSFLTFHTL